MRLVGYVRVSRVGKRKDKSSFISPREQRKSIESAGHEIVEWIEDLDQPGTRAERPGLMQAMEVVESGAAEGIIVAKLTRFGRSVANQGALLERLHAAGGALLTVSEGLDTRTDTGKMVANIIVSIAEWEVDRIREQWASARADAGERGVYLSEAPVGFEKFESGGIELKDGAAQPIRGAFKRRVSGDSWAKIARWLNDRGFPARRGGQWSVASVRRLVANRAYLDYGVVDVATYEAANAIKGVAPARSGRASGLLSGVLRCAGCRYATKLSQGHSRHGKTFTEYRCKAARSELAGGACPAPSSVKAHVIEPQVMAIFWDEVGNYALRHRAAAEGLEEAEAAVAEARAELDAALDERLVNALGGPDAPAYLAKIERLTSAEQAARASLAEISRRAGTAIPSVSELRALWPDLPLYEQRKLLASVLDCVFVRRANGNSDVTTRIHVCATGEAPELPVRGRRWNVQPFDFPVPAEAGV